MGSQQRPLPTHTMRSLVVLIWFLFLGSAAIGGANAQNLVFTSGYSQTEQSFILDLEAGSLSEAGQQETEPNLTFMDISEDGKSIYLVHEVTEYEGFGQTGAVSLWKKGRDPLGKPIFQKVQTFPSNGTGPCHVKVHTGYGLLHVSNYGGGSFTSYKIDENSGEIKGQIYNEYYGKGSNVVPDRQEYAHAHGAFTWGPYVYVADLGSDKIWKYKATEDGNLIKNEDEESQDLTAGFGPRHMAINSELKKAYVVFELQSYVGVYTMEEDNGFLAENYLVELMPEPSPGDAAAEIEISPSGEFLYVSNRGNGAIVVFKIMPDFPFLDRIQVQYLGGPTPRHFKIHPSGEFLIVAFQDSGKLEMYRIDSPSGLLVGEPQVVACPNSPTIVGLLEL